MTRRIHIDRLELSLRGIAPAVAETTAQLLGPALAQALRRDGVGTLTQGNRNTGDIDAGRIDDAASSEPGALATQMAGHIAQRIVGDRS
jgi:hypothetical protein